jgi:hypothetical protein
MSAPVIRFKPRHYLHFDRPISNETAAALVEDASLVAHRQFLPLLGYVIETNRIRRNPESGLIEVRPKRREIKVASHGDAAIYSHYSGILTPFYEREVDARKIEAVVTAFRKRSGGGNNVDFAGEVFRYIDANRPCVALAFDLEKFFDTLDHSHLKEQWCRILGVSRLPSDHFSIFRSLTNYCWVDRLSVFSEFGISRHVPKAGKRRQICGGAEFRERVRGKGLLQGNPTPGKGIPQGSPISALLSNVYMLAFDETVNNGVGELGGLYRRYCDDIIVVVPEESRFAAESLVTDAVLAATLTVNDEKTDRAHFPRGSGQPASILPESPEFSGFIQYLGFTYSGSQTLIRPGSVARYYGKMRAGVSLAKQTQRKYNRKEEKVGLPFSVLKTRKLFIQYSYLIKRRTRLPDRDKKAQGNFITYAYQASSKLGAPEIKRQVRRHWTKLQKEIRGRRF